MSNNKGIRNGNWKGGVSDYPNHYLMKINRLLKLQQVKGLCEIYNNHANVIHHIDGSKTEHSLENLIAVCHPCHWVLHTDCKKFNPRMRYYPDGRMKKFISWKSLYGSTWEELKEKTKLSDYELKKLHKKNGLAKYLKKYLDKAV